MIDLDTVTNMQGFQRFIVRRAYTAGQPLQSGRSYHSTRVHFLADCGSGRLVAALTAYYGEDRRLVHSEQRTQFRRSDLSPPATGSDAAEALTLACKHLAENPPSSAQSPKVDLGNKGEAGPASKPVPKAIVRGSTSGSGIVVSDAGHILTNHHVVNECDAHEIIDDSNVAIRAVLLASDRVRDLALLNVEKRYPNAAQLRSDASPKLGEAVTVLGYPLAGLLGSKPIVGFGHVSSTTGIRDNPSQMQISVPIQRGNSGGPVFDQSGNMIGVVVSKLDALKVAERVGDLPQNVNFAIRGEVVRAFLESHQVNFSASRSTAKLENTDIASLGAAVTVRVRCLRKPVATVAP